MDKPKVYFTDFRTHGDECLTDKMERLVKKAGFESIDFKNKFVA
nr:4Fe-4S ferredoxin [Clostridiales bacterium]